jgi:hypothetical protein
MQTHSAVLGFLHVDIQEDNGKQMDALLPTTFCEHTRKE